MLGVCPSPLRYGSVSLARPSFDGEVKACLLKIAPIYIIQFMDLDIINHPFQLVLMIALSIVSSYFLWNAFKTRNIRNILLGIGCALPTIDMRSYWTWGAGILAFGAGIWIAKIE